MKRDEIKNRNIIKVIEDIRVGRKTRKVSRRKRSAVREESEACEKKKKRSKKKRSNRDTKVAREFEGVSFLD